MERQGTSLFCGNFFCPAACNLPDAPMAPAGPDEVTLRRAMRRDPAACRALVEGHQALVFSVAARVLGRSSADLADVAQESFARAFQSLDAFDPAGPARFSTWLATLATRVAIDHARRARNVIPLDAIRDTHEAPHEDPGDALDAARRRARLAAAMERLAPDQRAAMLLRTEHDMSYEDIAAALGVEVGTVRSRLSRAKAVLLEALGERRHDEAAP